MNKILVSDCTLQKIAREQNSQLLFREKLAIVLSAENYGADRIVLPAVKNVKEDTIICKTISESVKNAAVCIPVGMDADGVSDAWNCVKAAVNPCLQVVAPVSTVQMEYLYHVKSDKMAEKIASLVSAARAYTNEVEFVAVDATRAEEAFLLEALQIAERAGATCVTLSDDAGTMLPEEFAALAQKAVKAVSIPVFAEVSNKISMAAANAFAAIKAGVSGVYTGVYGADTLKTDAFAEVIRQRGEENGISTGLKYTEINSDVDAMKKLLGREDYEDKNTEGQEDIYLDSESTLDQVIDAVKSLGYDLSDADYGNVYDELGRVLVKKENIAGKELEAIIASSAMQSPSTYHLESFVTTSGNLTPAVSQVVLVRDGEKITGVASGDGPIDSAFKAIEQSIGYHYELDLFRIEAVTEGKEALGSAVVRLRSSEGKLYSGNGVSADIVGATIRAYLNALNKIVYEEN